MGSIPKIVSTPLKWVSKKILHQTLLRFPGGDSHSSIACVYCPEMCRFSCPTAVVSSNDTVTPCNKMGLLYKEETWPGQASQGAPLWPIYDCTGCGRCTEYCVYDMPVAEQLFSARSKYQWDPAIKVAKELKDEVDLAGDLAHELGDLGNANRRLEKFLSQKNPQFTEPKAWHYYKKSQLTELQNTPQFLIQEVIEKAAFSSQFAKILGNGTWLFHESVWYSRHLSLAPSVEKWIEQAHAAGISIKLPFAHGMDCIDCGGEGAYHHLFPEQAKQIARDFWERDQQHAVGILCVSERCADHFRKTLGNSVPVYSLLEL